MENSEQEQNEGSEEQSTVLDDLEGVQIDGDDFEPNAEQLAQKEPEKFESAQFVLMAISPLFDVLAPNWQVQDAEKEALAEAYGVVIDEYFPDVEASPIIGAIICTAAVVAPRIGTPAKLEEKKTDLKIVDEASGD